MVDVVVAVVLCPPPPSPPLPLLKLRLMPLKSASFLHFCRPLLLFLVQWRLLLTDHLSIAHSLDLSLCLSVRLSVCLSLQLCIYPCAYPPIYSPWHNCNGWLGVRHLVTYLLTNLYISGLIYRVYLSICQSARLLYICLNVCFSDCLSVCLFQLLFL